MQILYFILNLGGRKGATEDPCHLGMLEPPTPAGLLSLRQSPSAAGYQRGKQPAVLLAAPAQGWEIFLLQQRISLHLLSTYYVHGTEVISPKPGHSMKEV